MANQANQQTMQQARAKHALNTVQDWQKEEPDSQKKLRSYASDLPAMILMNGLGQAIAFAKMKSKNTSTKEYGLIYQTLQSWLYEQKKPLNSLFSDKELIKSITNIDMQTYQLTQTEALLYLDWIKKFSKAFLSTEEAS